MDVIYLSSTKDKEISEGTKCVKNNLGYPISTPREFIIYQDDIDAIWALNNFKKYEIEFAKENGIRVLYNFDDLLSFLFERVKEDS